jgi:hypothetical protein
MPSADDLSTPPWTPFMSRILRTLYPQNRRTRIESTLPLLRLHESFAVNISQRDPIVEKFLLLIGKMSQTIPLGTHLRVERPDIVVDNSGSFVYQFLVERSTAEERLLR